MAPFCFIHSCLFCPVTRASFSVLAGGPILRIAGLLLPYSFTTPGHVKHFRLVGLAVGAPDRLVGKQPQVVLFNREGFHFQLAFTANADHGHIGNWHFNNSLLDQSVGQEKNGFPSSPVIKIAGFPVSLYQACPRWPLLAILRQRGFIILGSYTLHRYAIVARFSCFHAGQSRLIIFLKFV